MIITKGSFLAPARALHHHASERAFARTASGVQHAKGVHALEVRQLRRQARRAGAFHKFKGLAAHFGILRGGHTGRSKEKEEKRLQESFHRAHLRTRTRMVVYKQVYVTRCQPTPISYVGASGVDDRKSYGPWSVGAGLVPNKEVATGGRGAATPAVCEPSPSFCRVTASSLPLGFSPCPAWNFFMASTVESSHLPLGLPPNDPSLAIAC